MLLAVKSFETFLKHEGYFFSESFALNWYIFVALTNKKTVAPIIMQNFLFDLEKLIEYSPSVGTVVSSNPCVGPLPRIKISLFLLSVWTYESYQLQK